MKKFNRLKEQLDMNDVENLASFCLFTYNQEQFIGEAVAAALSQTYSPLEIIISDDYSTDSTREVIKNMVDNYTGPHQVVLNFNQENLGLSQHVNKVLYEICNGHYIFLAAGDDISYSSRVVDTIQFYKQNRSVVATGSNLQEIDNKSIARNTKNFHLKKQEIFDIQYYISAEYQHLYGCTRTLTREVVDAFPPLQPNCPTEDTPLLLRAFLVNKNVANLDKIMVSYRMHDNNISSPSNIKLMNIEAIFSQYYKDLKHALQQKYITREQYSSIRKAIKIREKHRLNKKDLVIRLKIRIYGLLNCVQQRVRQLKQ